jgi:Spy/CpxP family protein refolding chaperone
MRVKLILSLALFSIFCASPAFSQQPESGPPPSDRVGADMRGPMHGTFRIAPPGVWWKKADLVQKLLLTPDQQKRMDDIFQQNRVQLIDLKASVEKQETLLEPMLAANPPDTNKVLAQIDQVAQARAELEKAMARMLLGIRGVLTPDQWTKLQAEERDNRYMRRDGMPGGHRGPGGQDRPLPPPQ